MNAYASLGEATTLVKELTTIDRNLTVYGCANF